MGHQINLKLKEIKDGEEYGLGYAKLKNVNQKTYLLLLSLANGCSGCRKPLLNSSGDDMAIDEV